MHTKTQNSGIVGKTQNWGYDEPIAEYKWFIKK